MQKEKLTVVLSLQRPLGRSMKKAEAVIVINTRDSISGLARAVRYVENEGWIVERLVDFQPSTTRAPQPSDGESLPQQDASGDLLCLISET